MKRIALLLLALAMMAAPALAGPSIADPEIERLSPLFDSITRAFDDGDAGPADNDNPAFIWLSLFYLETNYGESVKGAVLTEDYLYVALPHRAVLEAAQAMFYGLQSLPPIPSFLTEWDSVMYDAGSDAYHFMLSDMGCSFTRIDDVSRNGDGLIRVEVGYYAGGEEEDFMDALTFLLDENPAEGSAYRYAIVSVGRG